MLAEPNVRGRYVREILARLGLGAAKAAWVLAYSHLGEDHCSIESGSQLAVYARQQGCIKWKIPCSTLGATRQLCKGRNSSVGFLRKATNAANHFGGCDDEINARRPNKKRASSFELKKRVLKIQVRVTAVNTALQRPSCLGGNETKNGRFWKPRIEVGSLSFIAWSNRLSY
ncbi:hypothetical protein VNO77_27050 [Canavalia gladiata]|uniref:Uncharacterized protein n=1 Tax=Canavalia gladiata TaxID=3824 RepID=A0AAN9KY55_CANGL